MTSAHNSQRDVHPQPPRNQHNWVVDWRTDYMAEIPLVMCEGRPSAPCYSATILLPMKTNNKGTEKKYLTPIISQWEKTRRGNPQEKGWGQAPP